MAPPGSGSKGRLWPLLLLPDADLLAWDLESSVSYSWFCPVRSHSVQLLKLCLVIVFPFGNRDYDTCLPLSGKMNLMFVQRTMEEKYFMETHD